MKTLFAIGTLALFSGLVMADTITDPTTAGSASTFTSVNLGGAALGSGVPYWDNHSGDFGGSNTADIGYFLTAQGNFSSGTNVSPNGYAAASSGSPDAPAAFNLVHSTNSLIISLIGVNTGNTSDMFGIYNSSLTGNAAVLSEVSLFGSTSSIGTSSTQNALSFSTIGFYMTDGLGYTWFSNDALNSATGTPESTTHQHFSLFTTSTDANTFYLGVEDGLYNTGEGLNGDYNDLVIKINADATGVPEPATIALMGAGLLGLGFARFRARKNRA